VGGNFWQSVDQLFSHEFIAGTRWEVSQGQLVKRNYFLNPQVKETALFKRKFHFPYSTLKVCGLTTRHMYSKIPKTCTV
jgi:hypothetical protein